MVIILSDPPHCSFFPFFHFVLSQGVCILFNILQSVLSLYSYLKKVWGEGGGELTDTSHIPNTFISHQSSADEIKDPITWAFFIVLSAVVLLYTILHAPQVISDVFRSGR